MTFVSAIVSLACAVGVVAEVVGLLLPASNMFNLTGALVDANNRYPGLKAANVTLQLQQRSDANTQIVLFDARTSVDARSLLGYPIVAFRGNDVALIDKSIYMQLFRIQPNAGSDAVAVAAVAVAAKQTNVIVLSELSAYADSAHPVLEASLLAAGIDIAADVQLRMVWDVAALTQALSTAKAAVTDERGSPNDVGAFVYVGADVALFQRTMAAAANLSLTGAPYLWIVTRAAFALLGNSSNGVPLPLTYNGMIALAPFASEDAYAHDAVLVAAAALNRVVVVDRAAISNTTIAAALRTARVVNGLTGTVSFNEDQDRAAQFQLLNVQAGRLVGVGAYAEGGLTLNSATAILYSTGERVPPAFPFRNCTKLASCADCLAQTKCAWCPGAKICALAEVAAAGTCSASLFTEQSQCPRECVESSPPHACLYERNLTIFSPHKPRCDTQNDFARTVAYPKAGMNACQTAFAAAPGCQLLVQHMVCSTWCQPCTNSSAAAPLPICRSTCDTLINQSCSAMLRACVGQPDRFAAYCGSDALPCTTTLVDAFPLTSPGAMWSSISIAPTLSSALTATESVATTTTTTAAQPSTSSVTSTAATPMSSSIGVILTTVVPVTAATTVSSTAATATTTAKAALSSAMPSTTTTAMPSTTTAVLKLSTTTNSASAPAAVSAGEIDGDASSDDDDDDDGEVPRYSAVGVAVGMTVVVCCLLIMFGVLVFLFARAHHCADDKESDTNAAPVPVSAPTTSASASPDREEKSAEKASSSTRTEPKSSERESSSESEQVERTPKVAVRRKKSRKVKITK